MTTATAVKGGALAKLAGMFCQQAAFWRFAKVDGPAAAAEWIRRTCDVVSRAELDHDDVAAQRFHDLVRRPYLQASRA